MENSELNLRVSVSTDTAVQSLDRLTNAAERCSAALQELGRVPNGGITIDVVGDVARIEIKPVD